MESEQGNQKIQPNGIEFIKSVARYFMDFLETDFHRRKAPKRSVKLKNSDNLLVGINLEKYPSFYSMVWRLINDGFNSDAPQIVSKGVYKANVPPNLVKLIELQLSKVKAKDIEALIDEIDNAVSKAAAVFNDEADKALTTALDNTNQLIKDGFVLPFITHLEKPLENFSLGDENNMYLMEEELTEVLGKLLENPITDILNHRLIDSSGASKKGIKEAFQLQDVKASILTFFQDFQVADVFNELAELERNRGILDKQECYLYFCDITFGKVRYPLFYIPFSAKIAGEKAHLEFDSRVYINKRALAFITQEYNNQTQRSGSIKSAAERILYLAKHKEDFKKKIAGIVQDIRVFFGLEPQIDLEQARHQRSRSLLVSVSNSCYFALSDKSDEALINDYEEICELLIRGDAELGAAFTKLIDDFIHKEPIVVNQDVQDEWDDTSTGDRLVYPSPVPLNEEQRQILSAIKKKDCRYITVEGPPGTGKSHTITAIVFDAILNDKSVLVLSDKKEALDVVENKITDTLKAVRTDEKFQNPILRLGKIGSNYSKILSAASVDEINNHYRAIRNEYPKVQDTIEQTGEALKSGLADAVEAYQDIDINEVHEFHDLERSTRSDKSFVDLEEMMHHDTAAIDLAEVQQAIENLKAVFVNDDTVKSLLGFKIEKASLDEVRQALEWLRTLHSDVAKVSPDDGARLLFFETFTEDDLRDLNRYIQQYETMRHWLFGYLTKGREVINLNAKFKERFPNSQFDNFKDNKNALKQFAILFGNLQRNTSNKEMPSHLPHDYFLIVRKLLENAELLPKIANITSCTDDIKYISTFLKEYPQSAKKSGMDDGRAIAILDNAITNVDELSFNRVLRYLTLYQKLHDVFGRVPELPYTESIKNIEELVTAQTAYVMDGRLVNFYFNNKSTASTLRDIIRHKEQFPRDEFIRLREAFPCILAGIRDYAEYIPLEPEIFDLLIIDEASQVSIAQAFPALLRAKKVLILGDRKQFSNIKSAQARSDTNREYLTELEDVFKTSISADPAKLEKLKKFNIKTSILEFFEFITNYHTQLRKHFRGYKELISYSNKYFYKDALQVMKIRGKPMDDVLKFHFVPHDGKDVTELFPIELKPNSNIKEAEYILKQLRSMKEAGIKQTVGIITPHTNQQDLLSEMMYLQPERDYFYDTLRLKIMTFDTCQGEERDIIYYSMVATEQQDRLWGVFIKNLADVDIEEEGRIKAQRLNVGLSRAKEQMNFVLSKPLDKYTGSIGEALRHYHVALEDGKKERTAIETDAKSKMEPQVLTWFYQTQFWKKNKEHIEFLPQFELGKYLKQLDPYYTHPAYRVDFLLLYKDETHREHKIIIEYDGFKEHFVDEDGITEWNYQHYYNEGDLYREKVLESYGYNFLRINRFNVGKNSIETLDKRLSDLVKRSNPTDEPLLSRIQRTASKLSNGQMKECSNCHQVMDNADFKDKKLISGVGRLCRACKASRGHVVTTEPRTYKIESGISCPRCNAGMVLRNGRLGRFYGCSRFPSCRGTRQISKT